MYVLAKTLLEPWEYEKLERSSVQLSSTIIVLLDKLISLYRFSTTSIFSHAGLQQCSIGKTALENQTIHFWKPSIALEKKKSVTSPEIHCHHRKVRSKNTIPTISWYILSCSSHSSASYATMASLSPDNYDYSNKSDKGDYASGQSEGGKSPLSMSLGFLKNLTEKKSTRVDSQTPKRRGPKPDSKPALTRRQELNRQAQRTHRERKELYIKALEQEVLRLKENFSCVTQSKQSLAEENRQLKQLLAQHGIQWSGSGGVDEFTNNQSIGYRSSDSQTGSYAPGSTTFSPPPLSQSSNSNPNSAHYDNGSPQMVGAQGGYNANGRRMAQQQAQDSSGVLERPCMDHMQFLVERSNDGDGEFFTGHALMASCPPEPDMDMHPNIPFGHCMPHNHNNAADGADEGPLKQKTWDLSKSDLANLLDLSKRLDLNGEITPVMAWGMVLGHPRFSTLKEVDFKSMSEELLPKVRCYGFGAALEEFEVRDALEARFGMDPN
ncbi:hypothetical protein EYC80_007828 [Monilinia laxa]|uniref:BZIP domain-containing protein n=1 Tax=Monilinia laxa TaxID=61186 RepID=A0A5N6JSN4_MONLA|nr:hypothetical protein EYC80_007828 [Monilinia laxa]